MTDHHINTNTQPPLADEGLRCPDCEYNLTGLDRDVCPECGEAFDREQLLAELASAPAPIPIWCRRNEIGTPRAFVQTLVEVWFHPIRFAKRFPENPNLREPIVFSRYCLAVAAILAALLSLWPGRGSLMGLVLIVTHCMIAVPVCERLVAATFFVLLVPDEWVAPWQRCLALVRMTRAFLVLSTTCSSISLVGELFLRGPASTGIFSIYASSAVAVYWWIVMVFIVTAHRRSVLTFAIALFGIPVISFLSIVAAYFVVLLIGELLRIL